MLSGAWSPTNFTRDSCSIILDDWSPVKLASQRSHISLPANLATTVALCKNPAPSRWYCEPNSHCSTPRNRARTTLTGIPKETASPPGLCALCQTGILTRYLQLCLLDAWNIKRDGIECVRYHSWTWCFYNIKLEGQWYSTCSLTRNTCITMAFHSFTHRWKMIIVQFSFIHCSSNGWDNLLFEVGNERGFSLCVRCINVHFCTIFPREHIFCDMMRFLAHFIFLAIKVRDSKNKLGSSCASG